MDKAWLQLFIFWAGRQLIRAKIASKIIAAQPQVWYRCVAGPARVTYPRPCILIAEPNEYVLVLESIFKALSLEYTKIRSQFSLIRLETSHEILWLSLIISWTILICVCVCMPACGVNSWTFICLVVLIISPFSFKLVSAAIATFLSAQFWAF